MTYLYYKLLHIRKKFIFELFLSLDQPPFYKKIFFLIWVVMVVINNIIFIILIIHKDVMIKSCKFWSAELTF